MNKDWWKAKYFFVMTIVFCLGWIFGLMDLFDPYPCEHRHDSYTEVEVDAENNLYNFKSYNTDVDTVYIHRLSDQRLLLYSVFWHEGKYPGYRNADSTRVYYADGTEYIKRVPREEEQDTTKADSVSRTQPLR